MTWDELKEQLRQENPEIMAEAERMAETYDERKIGMAEIALFMSAVALLLSGAAIYVVARWRNNHG